MLFPTRIEMEKYQGSWRFIFFLPSPIISCVRRRISRKCSKVGIAGLLAESSDFVNDTYRNEYMSLICSTTVLYIPLTRSFKTKLYYSKQEWIVVCNSRTLSVAYC